MKKILWLWKCYYQGTLKHSLVQTRTSEEHWNIINSFSFCTVRYFIIFFLNIAAWPCLTFLGQQASVSLYNASLLDPSFCTVSNCLFYVHCLYSRLTVSCAYTSGPYKPWGRGVWGVNSTQYQASFFAFLELLLHTVLLFFKPFCCFDSIANI